MKTNQGGIEDTKQPNKQINKKKTVIREWVEAIVVAALIALVIRIFLIEPFKIPTGSMRNTLLEGDIILVNKLLYGARIPVIGWRTPEITKPKRGDVIVFIYPEDPKKNFIKRLIGLSGDTVEIKNGTIYINSTPLVDALFNQRYYYNRGDFGRESQKVLVPENSYFVLGDNSASSQDSRYWGFVPKKNLIGKALLIYWPPQRIRMIE